MTADPQAIAACLGLHETTVRGLQARGYLLEFDLTEAEVRERLYCAHLAQTGRYSAGEDRAGDDLRGLELHVMSSALDEVERHGGDRVRETAR